MGWEGGEGGVGVGVDMTCTPTNSTAFDVWCVARDSACVKLRRPLTRDAEFSIDGDAQSRTIKVPSSTRVVCEYLH